MSHYKEWDGRSICFAEAARFIPPPEGVGCRTLTECGVPDKAVEIMLLPASIRPVRFDLQGTAVEHASAGMSIGTQLVALCELGKFRGNKSKFRILH